MLRRAHDVRSERLIDERIALADQVHALRSECLRLQAALAEAVDEAAGANQRAESAGSELQLLRATRTFRYSEPLRRIYQRRRG